MENILKKNLTISSRYYLDIIRYIISEGGEARLVGGVVRDCLLGIESYDVDIATNFLPIKVEKILNSHGIKTIRTGIKHGTITAIIKNEKFEITTLREDKKCYGRHAEVKFSSSFYHDASRRDFTINAMSYCPIQKKIFDYFGGIEHIKERKVIFIGNPMKRIKEDFLRILRFFRFSTKYSDQFHKESLNACIALRKGLRQLAPQRLKNEFDILLGNFDQNRLIQNLEIINNSSILENIFPFKKNEFRIDYLKKIDFSKNYSIKPDIITIYALLFVDIQGLDKRKLNELAFSNKEIQVLLSLINFIKKIRDKILHISEVLCMVSEFWLENRIFSLQYILLASMFLSLEHQSIEQHYNFLRSIKIKPIFPITGQNLLNANIPPKMIGILLTELKSQWIKSKFQDSYEMLISYLDKIASQIKNNKE